MVQTSNVTQCEYYNIPKPKEFYTYCIYATSHNNIKLCEMKGIRSDLVVLVINRLFSRCTSYSTCLNYKIMMEECVSPL